MPVLAAQVSGGPVAGAVDLGTVAKMVVAFCACGLEFPGWLHGLFCHQVRWYHDYRALRNLVRGFERPCLSHRGRLSGESSELLFSTRRHFLSGLPQFFLCEPKALLVEEQSSVGAGSTLSSVDAGSSAEPGPCWPRLHFLCPTSRCRPCPSPARSPTRGRSPSWSGRARAAGIPRWGRAVSATAGSPWSSRRSFRQSGPVSHTSAGMTREEAGCVPARGQRD